MEQTSKEEISCGILEWLETHSKMTLRLFVSGRTLADQQNPLFFGKDIELKSFEKSLEVNDRIFKNSGYVSRSILCEMDTNCRDKDSISPSGIPRKYVFLSNWEILWDYFEVEDSDEIAVHLPFLRASMEFVFHRRITQLVVIVFLWNLAIIVILQGIYRKYIAEAVFQTMWLNITFQFIVYLLISFMINGPEGVWWRKKKILKSEERSSNQSDASANIHDITRLTADAVTVEETSSSSPQLQQGQVISQSLSFKAALWDLWQYSKMEFNKLLFSKVNIVANKSSNNVSISIAKKNGSNRETVKPPLYYYRWLNIALKVLTRAYGVDISRVGFKRQSYRFILLFVFVGYPIYVLIMFYIKIGTVITNECGPTNHVAEACNFYVVQLFASGLGFSMVVGQYFYGGAVLLSLVGLAYGCEIAFRLAESWEHKFHDLRRIEVNNETNNKSTSDENKSQVIYPVLSHENTQKQPVLSLADADELVDLISRDATEHYLLICALIRRAGDLWSPVLLLFLFLMIYIAVSNVLLITTLDHSLKTVGSSHWLIAIVIFSAIRTIVFVLYPILSISFANTYFIHMCDIFRMADEDDYALIGGRDRWLSIFRDTPAAWTVFGVYITPGRLFAVLWTALVALGGIMISKIISSGSLLG